MVTKIQGETKCYKIYNYLHIYFWIGDSGSQITKVFKVHWLYTKE